MNCITFFHIYIKFNTKQIGRKKISVKNKNAYFAC